MSTILNTVTLGGKTVYDPPAGVGNVNFFAMHTGAARYGRGAFLLTRSDYNDLVSNSADGTAQLVFYSPQGPNSQVQNGNYQGNPIQQLSMQVMVAGAEPLTTADGSNTSSDMLKVNVFDLRCQQYGNKFIRFNIMKPAMTATGSSPNAVPDFISSTINSGTPYTWSDVATRLESSSLFSGTTAPTWTPYNLAYDNLPLCRIIDDVAGKLFLVAGWNYSTSTYILYSPGKIDGTNSTYLTQAKKIALIGGTDAVRNSRRLPNKYAVIFEGFVNGSSDPGNDQYIKTITTAAPSPPTGNGITMPLHVGGMIAINGAAPSNQTNLDACATDLASRAYTAANAPMGQFEFVGIWPFFPDGTIRGIKWISDRTGARTIIRLNNDQDWSPLGQLQFTVETQTNTLVAGVGGAVVGMNSGSGTRYVLAQASGSSLGTGQYQYQVPMMVSQNQVGWDFTRAHAMVG